MACAALEQRLGGQGGRKTRLNFRAKFNPIGISLEFFSLYYLFVFVLRPLLCKGEHVWIRHSLPCSAALKKTGRKGC